MGAMPQHGKALTPEQVAEHYGCSANHIRNLIKRGELRAFRLGRRLLRVPVEALGEYEQCHLNIGSDGSIKGGSSRIGETESGGVIVLRAPAERTPSGKQ